MFPVTCWMRLSNLSLREFTFSFPILNLFMLTAFMLTAFKLLALIAPTFDSISLCFFRLSQNVISRFSKKALFKLTF